MSSRQEVTSPGRERQKSRTRRALVAAAVELVRAGRNPTVAEVAEAAEVSRATAYRYYPTQDVLLAEVALFAIGGPLVPGEEADSSLAAPEAIARLVRRVGEWAYDNEPALRTAFRLSLDPSSGFRRPAHRVGWIADALADVKGEVDPRTFERLSGALTLLLGIDPVVVMSDIANAPREEALETLEWTARTLVQGALGETASGRSGAKRGRPARRRPQRPEERTGRKG